MDQRLPHDGDGLHLERLDGVGGVPGDLRRRGDDKTRKMEVTREVTGNAAKVQLPWTSSGWANAGTFTAVLGTLSLAALAFAGRSVAHRYSQYHRMTPGPEMQNELASEQTTRDLLEEY